MTYVPVGKSNILVPQSSSYWSTSPENPVYQGRRIAYLQSPDATYLPELGQQQASSSDLVRNEPISSAAIQTMVHGTVGSGMRPESQIDHETAKISESEASETQKKAEFLFQYWSTNETCDLARTHTFWELENLAFNSSLEFGDCFPIRRFQRDRKPYGLCLQLVEAMRVDTPPEQFRNENVRAGIKFDRLTGERKSIFVREHDDYGLDFSSVKYKEIKVKDRQGNPQVLFIHEPKRVGETRGIPYLSVITNIIKSLGKYSEAEVTAALFQAFIAFVTKTKEGDDVLVDDGFVSSSDPEKTMIPRELKPFTNIHIGTDEDVKTLEMNRPNKNFEAFFAPMMKIVGAQLQIPAQVILMAFDASYTASMAALERAFEVFKIKRKRLVSQFHRHVWSWFWDESVARGYLHAPGYWSDPLIRAAFQGAMWVGDPCIQLDRWKAAKAARELHDLGIVSKKTLTQMLTGNNYERVVAQRAKERELEPKTLAGQELSAKEQEDFEKE
ncbi:MAG: phage portal protein [Oligoflexales bacterium]